MAVNSGTSETCTARELCGSVSMFPQADAGLEIDPDPSLEREAEQTARRVMQGGELGVQRLGSTEVYVQRIEKHEVVDTIEMLEAENEDGNVGDFQQEQNERRLAFLKEEVKRTLDNLNAQEDAQHMVENAGEEQLSELIASEQEIETRVNELEDEVEEKAEQVALTDDQRTDWRLTR